MDNSLTHALIKIQTVCIHEIDYFYKFKCYACELQY